MTYKTADFKLITSEEYLGLANPEWVGQSTPNEAGIYFMYWKVTSPSGVEFLYKTRNVLLTLVGDMADDFNSNNEDY